MLKDPRLKPPPAPGSKPRQHIFHGHLSHKRNLGNTSFTGTSLTKTSMRKSEFKPTLASALKQKRTQTSNPSIAITFRVRIRELLGLEGSGLRAKDPGSSLKEAARRKHFSLHQIGSAFSLAWLGGGGFRV